MAQGLGCPCAWAWEQETSAGCQASSAGQLLPCAQTPLPSASPLPTLEFFVPCAPPLPALVQVHTGMAEQAFKNQVQSVLGDGNLTPDRAAALEKMREQMGLPKENADKIIRGFTNQKAIAGMQVCRRALG